MTQPMTPCQASFTVWLFVLHFGVFLLSSGCSPAKVPSPTPTQQTAFDLDGKPADPLTQLGSKVGVLIFSRTDCPIARRYSPEIRRLQEAFAEQGVKFYLVFPNPNRTAAEIRDYLKEFELTGEALRDPDHVLVAKTGATVTPEAVVFTSSDDILYRGRIDNRFPKFGVSVKPTTHELEEAIKAAITGTAPPEPDGPAIGCYIEDLK